MMKSSKRSKCDLLVILLIVNVSLAIYSNGEPTEFLKHFRKFSDDLIAGSKETTEATETKPGVHLFNPFGIGMLLAHINEQVWNVSSSGIPEALHVQKKAISTEYAQLIRLFKGRHFRLGNTVYSRFGNLSRPIAFDQYLTHMINLDFTNQTAEFLDSFNSFIDLGSKGHLNNEILPKMLWKKVFENSTAGAYLNTLYYKGIFKQPWIAIGDKPFNYDSFVPFMQAQGMFKMAETENITAVVFQVQAPAKNLIFFKAHTYMDTPRLREEFLKLRDNSSAWSVKNMTVQVPAVNTTNMARHHYGLSRMGVNETFCVSNVTTPADFYYTQQPIVQGNHFEITPTYIEIASASGTLVNYQNDDVNAQDSEFTEDYYDDDYEIVETNPELDDIEEHVNSRQFKNQNRQRFRRAPKPLGGCGRTEDLAPSTLPANSIRTMVKQGKSSRILTFDTPFSWILEDEEIGEVFYGDLRSICQYQKASTAIVTSPTHAWLHDVFKVAFWKCLSR